ncbi:MAG: DUF6599 family protein [Bryobacteraceae bacterium]|jgi:hypothetical protein
MQYLLCALLLPGLSLAAILPDSIGAYTRGAVSQPTLENRPLWDEYGLKNWESAAYQNGKARFVATAYQLGDTTGALAAFDWQRPQDAKPSTAAKLSAETAGSLLLVHGNYLFSFSGYKPSMPELDAVAAALLNVDNTVLPALPGYLPSEGLVANSQRYVLGPAGLQKFAPAIPPSVAAFHLGAEAQLAIFHNPKGDLPVAIFDYPTPQMAIQKVADFEKLPGALAKRSGPLVAVVLSPPDPDFAERLLSQVRYQAEVTRDEYVPTRRDNIGDLVINAFILIGILLAFSLVSGLGLGAVRAYLRHIRHGEEPDAMITLHLQ